MYRIKTYQFSLIMVVGITVTFSFSYIWFSVGLVFYDSAEISIANNKSFHPLLEMSTVQIELKMTKHLNRTNGSGKINADTFQDFGSTKFQAITNNESRKIGTENSEEIVLVSVICGHGRNFDEFIVMIKSAITLQLSAKLRFVLLCEESVQSEIDLQLQHMRSLAEVPFSYQILNISVPQNRVLDLIRGEKKLRLPCATQRLYLPGILTNEKKILYVDTDVVFMNSLSTIWRTFDSMNPSQLSAAVLETETPEIGYYSNMAEKLQYPIYGESGLNSGVLFMDLEKIRQIKWDEEIDAIIEEYKWKMRITMDQDIINIYFLNSPEKLFLSPCTHNYRWIHCYKINDCPEVETSGVSMLHGWSDAFHYNTRGIIFKAIYDTFSQYEIGTDPYVNIVQPLEDKIIGEPQSNMCSRLGSTFLMNLKKLFPKSPL